MDTGASTLTDSPPQRHGENDKEEERLVIADTRRSVRTQPAVIGAALVALITVVSIALLPHGLEVSTLAIVAYLLFVTALYPRSALFILVVGLPLHNLLMAGLFHATDSTSFVKLVQPWKEAVLAVALVRVMAPVIVQWLKTRRTRLTVLDSLLLLFIALCAFSAVMPSALVPFVGRLYGFRNLVVPLSIYFLGRQITLSKRDIRVLIGLVSLNVLVYSVAALGERLIWGNGLYLAIGYGDYLKHFLGSATPLPFNTPFTFYTGSPYWFPRVGSLTMNPLDLGILLIIGLPILLVSMSILWRRGAYAKASILGILCMLDSFALVLAWSRSMLLLLPIVLLLVAVLGGIRQQWRGVSLTLLGCILGVCLLSTAAACTLNGHDPDSRLALSNRGIIAATNSGACPVRDPIPTGFSALQILVKQSTSASNTSTQGHVSSVQQLSRIQGNQFFGYGIGSAGLVGVRFHTGLGAESAYLSVGVELGLAGLALYLALFLGALWACWQGMRSRASTYMRAVFLGATIAWFVVLVDGITAEVTLNLFVMELLWVLTGMAVTLTRTSRVPFGHVPARDAYDVMAPQRPLRVAMDVQALRTARTGVRTYLEELLAHLGHNKNGCVIIPVSGPPRLPNSKRMFRMVNQGVHLLWLHVWLPVQLAVGNYDVLFSPEYLTPVWVPVARVVTYHDSSFLTRANDYNPLWSLFYRRIVLPTIRRADAIIVPSRHAAREATVYAHLPAERIYVVPLGGPDSSETMHVDAATASQTLAKYGLTSHGYFLHVGVLERRKNLAVLIQAFDQWRRTTTSSGFTLVLVGQAGPRPDLDDSHHIQEEISRLGLHDAVVLTGHVSVEERNALYTNAAVVAIPSLLEGFGIPVLEAFAARVPAVVSNACSLPEVAGEAALLFDPMDVQALAGCFTRLEHDPALRQRLIESGVERLRLFTWERTGETTCEVFQAAASFAYAPWLPMKAATN